MTTRTHTLVLPLLAALLSVGAGESFAAGEDPNALNQQAKNLRMAGDDEGAYRLHQRAYELVRSAENAAHMGMAEINLALWVEAEAHLREALRSPNDPFIVRNRDKIIDQLRNVRTHLGMLEVVGRPSGAEVEVAGKPIGRLPLPGAIRVPIGEVNIRVAAPGHRTERRDVEIKTNQLRRVAFELQVASSAEGAPMAGRPVGGYVPSEAALRARENPLRTRRQPAESSWKRPLGWTAALGAVALTGAGLWGVRNYNIDVERFNDAANVDGSPDGRCDLAHQKPKWGGARCEKLMNHANDMKKWATISFAGAAVVGVAAIVLFANATPGRELAREPGQGQPERQVAMACAPTLDSPGGVCAFRF